MTNQQSILEGHSDLEKGAYLGAIASIATADREATQDELEHISQLCDAANLSEEQKQLVLQASSELSGEELNRCLDVLKKSNLKYSLVTDLIAFAKADNNYSELEQQNVQKIAQYLGVDQKQFSLLDQFAEKASATNLPAEEISKPSFLSSLGLQDKMQNAGINTGGLFKSLLGFAGPMILGGLLSNAMNRRTGGFGGGFMPGGQGGLGSLIGMLSGGRGFGSTGGLLGRIIGGGGF
jgi:uncharacterized tellurite resistance protein B-like protein